jgi:MFS family permease
MNRNVVALSVCQGLVVANTITVFAVGSLAGSRLAPDKSLATLSITAYTIGAALTTYLFSLFMKRHGRRAGFTLGTVAGAMGAVVCAVAVLAQSFWLFCLGTLISGMYFAAGGYHRFAAADAAPAGLSTRAISFVLAGGIIGGVLGPETSKLTKDLLTAPFVASYIALALFALAALVIIRSVDLPAPPVAASKGPPRRLPAIIRDPRLIVACLGAVTAYAVMNLLMAATPLAMQGCGLPFAASTLVMEVHIVGMFAPALFSGRLVQRFGALPIMGAGIASYVVCLLIGLTAQGLLNFALAAGLLGVGWCFLYVGATTLLTQACRPEEKARMEGMNDLLVFTIVGTTSALSGPILYRLGWNALNLLALPWLIVASVGIGSLAFSAWSSRNAVRVRPGRRVVYGVE